MMWYHFIAAFFSGMFLCNTVPHFVQGISGNKFPTPFAKPPGKGLSSATTNMYWSLFNLVVGILLFFAAPIDREHPFVFITFIAGVALLGIFGANNFTKKDKE